MSSTVLHPILYPLLPSPAHSASWRLPRRQIHPPPLGLRKVQEITLADEAALFTGGLRTPPAEVNMSTAYHNHPHAVHPYDAHSHGAFPRQSSTLAPGRMGSVQCEAAVNHISTSQPPPAQLHHHQQQQYQNPHPGQNQLQTQPHYPSSQLAQHVSTLSANPQPHSTSSRHSTRPSTPSSTGTSHLHSEGTMSRKDSTMVMHSLQLPSCISPNGGSLDEFAALMTCFFWFENMDTIHAAEQIKDTQLGRPIPPLSSYTRPCAAYKKWVHSILTTTQVTQNVVLLALMFVYRLKSTNPKVNGSPGSEYRLLTVALMLGNKFLDDNTYTNKTWAEVSGISVKEIHVMEVEFLSNMRYGLLASKEQWADWLRKLACFHEYCERAEMTERATEIIARRQRASMAPVSISSPSHRGYSSPLPSPTSILPSTMQGSTPSLTAYSPNSVVYNAGQNMHGQYQPAATLSPLSAKPNLPFTASRKRSPEGPDLAEPAPKRMSRQIPDSLPPHHSRQPTMDGVRLPIPHLNLDTSQIATAQVTYPASTGYSQAPVSLPPLGPGVRAMATVFPNATSWQAPAPVLATSGPQTPSFSAQPNYNTPTKRHSPGSLALFASSPLTDGYASHTPISNSPSVYLQQRNSPYRPVRPVNTLNYPPPSVPLSEYHMGSSQMHYQPLGRRNVRTGIVPEFQQAYGSGRPTPVPMPHGSVQQQYHS